ncbi:MAG: type II toxin-antitoxin system RelE/ParE family toxin [Clostridia bacterium]|nr:type II toxin-antitoxin system RelE/ParE family toxin [Clostridia bacterium]
MYNVQYLPIAQNDLLGIAQYISSELGNAEAAIRLTENIIRKTDVLGEFPYSCPVYVPIRQTKNEYRKLRVDNYLVFYSVNEKEKTVTVMRIIYARRDFEKLL